MNVLVAAELEAVPHAGVPPGLWIALGIVLGAAVGSFLNVVVYRLPRGMSLNRPGSRCPQCGRKIRWHDNVPVLGWIWLGGRCRDCGAPISVRYPVVEALLAAIGGMLAWRSIAIDAHADVAQGVSYTIDLPLFGFYLLLTFVVIAEALVEFDGHRLPRWFLPGGLAVGLMMALAWPHLVPADRWATADGLVAALAGMGLALVVGVGPWIVAMLSNGPAIGSGGNALFELLLVGAFLGGRGALLVAVASTALCLAARCLAVRWAWIARIGWAQSLAGATLLAILLWPMLGTYEIRVPSATVLVPMACALATTLLSLASHGLVARRGRLP